MKGEIVPGKRAYPDGNGVLWLNEGEYGQDLKSGIWYARPPGQHVGSLDAHQVIEHHDGTISVTPSILIKAPGPDGEERWHGYLERGNWQEV